MGNTNQLSNPPSRSKTPLLLVLSGPSGVGKDAVLARLKTTNPGLQFITTLTTRARRPKEVDGIDYRFVSQAEFEQLLNSGGLLEHATVYNNLYGTPKQPIRNALTAGKDCIVKVDVQGAATIRKLLPDAVLIFLMPPSLQELGNRLRQRYTEDAAQLEIRLKTAASEMDRIKEFDYVVMNNRGGLDAAVADIDAIIRAEKCRFLTRQVNIP